jgi:hypothetical protein
MQIIYDNKISVSTPSTENPDYPIENLDDKRLSKIFKTTSAEDQSIVFDGPIKATRIVIAGHNFSVDSMIRVQGNNTNVWTAPSYNSLATYKSGIILHKITEATYNYWRLFVDDAESNANDYLSIGRLFLGEFLQMPGMKIDQILTKKTTSENKISSSGGVFGDKRYGYRSLTVNFPSVSETQRQALLTMWDAVENIEPFFIVPWANREDIETPIYCIFDQDEITFKRSDNYMVPWSTTLKFREVF